MLAIVVRRLMLSLMTCLAVAALSFPSVATAQWVHEGQAKEGKWTASFRAGLSIPTQETFFNSDGGLGPALNFQIQYGLNKYFALGFMVEWERRGYDQESPNIDIGTLNTVSLMPTLEFRPGRFGEKLMPYVSTGIGVNVNSFSEESGVPSVSMANTFAFRVAGGLDYALTERFMLNAELAWKRNRGGLDVGGQNAGSFDASAANLLFGVKYTF